MNHFIPLMRKDWRLNRATVIGLLIMNIVSYGLGLSTYLWDKYTSAGRTRLWVDRREASHHYPVQVLLSQYISPAAEIGSLFIILAAGVIGGAAFATERREQSADFLAMLPVKRRRIIASKLLVSFAVLGSFMAIEIGILLVSNFFRSGFLLPNYFFESWRGFPELRNAVVYFAVAGMVFGMGWLLSTFMNSTAIAASVATLLAICGCLVFNVVFFKDFMPTDMIKVASCAAVIFVLVGNIYYVRRVAP